MPTVDGVYHIKKLQHFTVKVHVGGSVVATIGDIIFSGVYQLAYQSKYKCIHGILYFCIRTSVDIRQFF